MLSNPFLFIYSNSQNQGGSFTVEVLIAGRKLAFCIPTLGVVWNHPHPIKATCGYFQVKPVQVKKLDYKWISIVKKRTAELVISKFTLNCRSDFSFIRKQVKSFKSSCTRFISFHTRMSLCSVLKNLYSPSVIKTA